MVSYKVIYKRKVVRYIYACADGVSVEDIIRYSGAEKLRVYPILFELEQNGNLLVLERESFGAPKIVAIVNIDDFYIDLF